MRTLSQISSFSLSLSGDTNFLPKAVTRKQWKLSTKVIDKYLAIRKKSVGNHFFQILKRQTLNHQEAKVMLERLSNKCFLKVLKAHQFDPNRPLEVNRYVKLHWVHEFAQMLPDCHDEQEGFEFANAVWNQILVWCLQGNQFILKDENGYIFEKENNFWWIKEN